MTRRDNQEPRAPVQGEKHPGHAGYRPPGTITWSEHVEAWNAYAKRFGTYQSAKRMAERGGFGWSELVQFLGREPSTWKPWEAPRG